MIWLATALILILVSAGLTYMIVNLVRDEEDLGFRDYLETYVVILMLLGFVIYFGG